MKKNLRPGYLTGFQGLRSRATRTNQKTRTGLGAFGKGAYVPIPNAPPGSIPMEDAINTTTGKVYMQDPRCPEGEKMVTRTVPCEGPDCDPGEVETEEECEDDQTYQLKPTPAPKLQPSPQAKAAPAAAKPTGPTAAQQAELVFLSQEAAKTEAMVTAAPALAPPSAYTGSPMPVGIPTRTAKTPDDEQVIMELVAQHRDERPVSRPRPRPAPVRETMQTEQPAIPGLLAWLKAMLFGTGNGDGNELEGWANNKTCKYGVSLITAVLITYFLLKARQ